ncbi:hypothetical protein [Streptomyces sp. NPDC058545]|uniref:hypothetical protein n=1 Tax=Streptomyces sp. NPDC058545 TaxID=3346544 RepID=UPI003663C516
MLLFPTLGDARLSDDAVVALTAALDALTLIEEPADVARMLLETQGQWEPAHWWSADGIWINDGGHSYRNPWQRLHHAQESPSGNQRRSEGQEAAALTGGHGHQVGGFALKKMEILPDTFYEWASEGKAALKTTVPTK